MTNDSLFENVDGDWLRLQVKSDDEGKFEQRIARLQRVKLHKIIPHLWFDLASTECRDLFRDGHYYGCICLSQSVAEGIAKFVLEVHREKVGKQQRPIESCRKPMTGRQLIARLKKFKGGVRGALKRSKESRGVTAMTFITSTKTLQWIVRSWRNGPRNACQVSMISSPTSLDSA